LLLFCCKGKQEFSGKSKRNTLKSKEKAQSRKSAHPFKVRHYNDLLPVGGGEGNSVVVMNF
jgi:hypothetical protein